MRSKVRQSVSTLDKSVLQFSDSLSKLQESRRTIVDKFSTVEKEINATADRLVAIVELQRRQLLTECDLIKAQRLKQVDHDVGEVTQNKTMADSLRKYCEELLDKGSNSDITTQTKSVGVRVEEIQTYSNYKPKSIVDDIVTFTPCSDVISESISCLGKVIDGKSFFQSHRFISQVTIEQPL
jgi:hypothetical protein